ncbi:MAG: hypothetical protein C5B55_07405 [Blastocatellia bacterium]|nr:MAG: hypothetical protein C5B55_07405 [Blastocatellia bacterium]
MRLKTVPLTLILVLFAFGSLAQTPNRRTPVTRKSSTTTAVAPAQPAATPAPVAAAPVTRPPASPIPLVTVNGQTITTADFPAELRSQIESVEDRIAETRNSVLQLQINTELLQREAKRRGITTHELYETEIAKKVPAFTPAQIKKFYDDNKDQFQGVDPVADAKQISNIMHDEVENRLADELVQRLRKTTPVVMGVDINTPNLNENAVVATIGGQPLRASALRERLKPLIYNFRSAAYDAMKQKADQMVDDILLLAEANRKQVGPEQIVRTEVSDKVRTPSDAEVTKFYSENKARISGDLATVRNQVVSYLEEEDRKRLEQALSDRLRKGADVRWLITEPPQPVQQISIDDDPMRGDVNAPVTVVEFGDFECPACGAMQPVLEEVLPTYGNKVRFVMRDFPLAQHEFAEKAAEAANAAKAQGKFFEYASLLFKRQKALDVPSLKKYASEIGLDRARFDAELDRGIYAAEVKHDMEDGEMYGISSTPAIFINGVRLKTLSAEGLREAIDRALAAASKAGTPPQTP